MKRFVSFVSVFLFLFLVAQAEGKGVVYSVKNHPDLYELIHLDRVKDSERIESIASDFEGKVIELYLVTGFVEQYRNYKTRFNYVLYAVYGDNIMLTGPAFMFKDVAYRDIMLTGPNKPDVFDIGLICRVKAEVDGLENGFILLDPISTEVVSADVAARESANNERKLHEGESAKRKKSGFNSKTNQVIVWCGVQFSFPSYFDVLMEDSTDLWTTYYPHEENYYASLMFQSADLLDVEGLMDPQSFFNASLPNVIEATFYSGEFFTDITIIKSEKIEIAGLPGWTVEHVGSPDEKGEYSIGSYAIAYSPEAEKVFFVSCVYDSIDQSRYDYLGDYRKILETARLMEVSSKEAIIIPSKTKSDYDFAYARKFSDYSIYMLFDNESKTVRSFSTSDKGVLVGSMKGDLKSGITIQYKYDGQWEEVFRQKPGSQTEAILIDDDGFDWAFEQVPVEEAEAILNSAGYHDMN